MVWFGFVVAVCVRGRATLEGQALCLMAEPCFVGRILTFPYMLLVKLCAMWPGLMEYSAYLKYSDLNLFDWL